MAGAPMTTPSSPSASTLARQRAVPRDDVAVPADASRRLAVDERPLGRCIGSLAGGPVVQPDRVDRPGSGTAGPSSARSTGPQDVVRPGIGPGVDPAEPVRSALDDLGRACGASADAVASADHPLAAHEDTERGGHRSTTVARRIGQARAPGSASSGATAARMTSAMPPTPVQRSNAMAACGMSISEPLARAQAARPGRPEQRGLGRHVDEVEDRRARRQQADVDGHARARPCRPSWR